MTEKEKNDIFSFNKIKKTPNLPDLVANQIIEKISRGDLKPGDKLPSEMTMIEDFGVSRLSLREAMKILEARGYIESHGRKGKFIRQADATSLETAIEDMISIDNNRIWELLIVRRIIDSEAAKLATLNATDKQISELKDYIEKAEKIGIKNLVSADQGGKLYKGFYTLLAEMTNIKIYAHLMKSISSMIRGAFPYSRAKIKHLEGISEIFYKQHLRIIQAIEERKPHKAKKAVEDHIDWLRDILKSVLEG